VVARAASIGREAGGVFAVKAMARLRTGLIVTGNEIYSGLIQDQSAPMLRPKLEALGCSLLQVHVAPDDPDAIARTLGDLIGQGAELIVATGGMSVDPDDVTRLGILRAGADEVLYGSAVLPGAMLLVARVGRVPVIGVPACAIYHDQTIFDLILPRILAGERLNRRDLAALSHGGLCLNCETCHYPICPFGKAA
jgi:molybdenum cofactor synthesis domain-containing protein